VEVGIPRWLPKKEGTRSNLYRWIVFVICYLDGYKHVPIAGATMIDRVQCWIWCRCVGAWVRGDRIRIGSERAEFLGCSLHTDDVFKDRSSNIYLIDNHRCIFDW
jgi:hypothetical protein